MVLAVLLPSSVSGLPTGVTVPSQLVQKQLAVHLPLLMVHIHTLLQQQAVPVQLLQLPEQLLFNHLLSRYQLLRLPPHKQFVESSAIANIKYTIGGTGTGATVTGLPAGVTGAFAAGVETISGTPTVAGAYTYTVTTTGGTCTAVTANEPLTVQARTITLTSAVGTNAQTDCYTTAITNITYSIGGTVTGATVAGLPASVTGAFATGTETISGTLTGALGTSTYTVTTSGGACGTTTATGTITEQGQSIGLTSGVGTNNQTFCKGTAIPTQITYSIGGLGTGASVAGLPTGMTGTFAGSTETIKGTPTVSGVFTYTVTTSGTGCLANTATGTLTIQAATVALSSGVGTNAQTVCQNTAISNITYTIGGTATGATVTGLPTGVTASYAAGTETITGTPTAVSGTYTYTVTTSGGACTNATANGTITIQAPTVSLSQE